jgi:heterodisulfide reductase subunit B
MMEFGYYPGCALHGSSNDYEQSVRVCTNALGVKLNELNDWICCGATAAHAVNHKLSVALPARNLGIAERDGLKEVLAPCPMCSMELIKASSAIRESGQLRKEISEIVELPVTGETKVINIIQLFQQVGIDNIKNVVKRPLTGLKAACYYGCLLTRPPKELQFDDCEKPTSMQTILKALGGDAVEWNYETECCGAGMTMARENTVLDLSNRILSNASAHGANCMVVACPMCHVNLDMKQADIVRQFGVKHDLPVFFISDLVGLALGLTEKQLGVDRHFVVKSLETLMTQA